MKTSTKKLFLISLVVGTPFLSCKATSPNNNNQQVASYNNNNQQISLDPFTAKFLSQVFERTHQIEQRETEARLQKIKAEARRKRRRSDKRAAEFWRQKQEANKRARQAQQKSAEFKDQKLESDERARQAQQRAAEAWLQKLESDERAHQAEQRAAKACRQKIEAETEVQKTKDKVKRQKMECEKRDRRIKRNKQRQKYIIDKLVLQERNYSEAITRKANIEAGMASFVGRFFGNANNKKVPDNRETVEKLQQEARKMYLSSSDEDDSNYNNQRF